MRSPVVGTSEIALSVANLPAMRDFYVRVLGFALHSESRFAGEDDKDESPTISFLIIAQMQTPLGQNGHPQLLALIDFRRHEFAKSRFDGQDIRRSTLNHLAFEILPENYESEFQRLDALGLSPARTKFPDLNAKAIFFRDPEGNTLELICHDDLSNDH